VCTLPRRNGEGVGAAPIVTFHKEDATPEAIAMTNKALILEKGLVVTKIGKTGNGTVVCRMDGLLGGICSVHVFQCFFHFYVSAYISGLWTLVPNQDGRTH
jgi:hypothetical protein